MLPSEMMERQSPDKKMFVSAATTVPLHKRYIFADLGGGTTYQIDLPNVSEAEGRKFAVSSTSMATAGGTSGRLIVDYTNGAAAGNTTGINTTGVEVEFESIGLDWLVTR